MVYIKPGKLFIMFGPSGVGKTTLAREIIERMKDDLVTVRSYTTRLPRQNERQGIDYWFISEEEFKRKIEEQFFLEYSSAYKAYYGSSYKEIIDLLQKGRSVLLIIDSCGVKQILQRMPDAIAIHILPPTLDLLRERLYKRPGSIEQEVEFRMQQAEKEVVAERYENLAKFVVVNDDLEVTIKILCNLIQEQISV